MFLQSVVRVVFHERRLQFMEREQLETWRKTRPGERIVDIGKIQIKVESSLKGRRSGRGRFWRRRRRRIAEGRYK